MLAIVRIALSRPYTFVVMAMLIVIFGVTAWFRTPTDIFPNIGIPVVAVVWTYNGLPPDDMSGRVIYYYERSLSHAGQRYRAHRVPVAARLRRRQSLLPAEREYQRRARADHRGFANRLETAAARHHAALRAQFQRVERADSATGAVQRRVDAGADSSTPARISFARNWRPSRARRFLALWRQGAPGPDRPRSARSFRPMAFRPGRRRRDRAQNLITPVGTEKIGHFEYVVALNDSPTQHRRTQRSAGPRSNGATCSFATSPMCMTAARRRSIWCASTAPTRC